MHATIFKQFKVVVEHLPVPAILDMIRDGRCKAKVMDLRILLLSGDKAAYDMQKKSLPAFTPSGTFEGGRKLEYLKEYSSLLILDIDKLPPEQLASVKSLACDIPFTYACFISPSGNGLKIIVVTDSGTDEHVLSFNTIKEYYENILHITIDKSGKDITRLCFLSWDPDIYINQNYQTFKISEIMLKNEIEYIIQQIELRKLDITGGYENWLNIGFALVDSFREDGREYFHHISQFNEDYNQEICNEQYDKCLKSQGQGITIKTLFQLAKDKGIDISRVKSVTIVDPNKKPEKKPADKSEKFKSSLSIEQIEKYLNSVYAFRYNVVTGYIEYRRVKDKDFSLMNDYVENSIFRELLKNNIPLGIDKLRSLLKSDFCPVYNPFKEYFYSLPPWDGQTDHILNLVNTVKTTNDVLWGECFRKWVVAAVASVLNNKVVNHTVIIFSGSQGIGKTTWMENLCPAVLSDYKFTGTINPGNKDTLVHLSECMFINMDELENMNRSEIGTFKELITKSTIRLRRAYGHNNENLIRRASFMGSVNTSQFLSDTTGSRRFLCFEVLDIDYKHQVDMDLVYSQALYLYTHGYKYYFDKKDIESITLNNEQFQLRTTEEELLLTWFQVPGKGDSPMYLSASEILVTLSEKAKISITTGNAISLGKALKKNGFQRCKHKGRWVWAVLLLTWEQVEKNTNKLYPVNDENDLFSV